jgi:hypothetical protein
MTIYDSPSALSIERPHPKTLERPDNDENLAAATFMLSLSTSTTNTAAKPSASPDPLTAVPYHSPGSLSGLVGVTDDALQPDTKSISPSGSDTLVVGDISRSSWSSSSQRPNVGPFDHDMRDATPTDHDVPGEDVLENAREIVDSFVELFDPGYQDRPGYWTCNIDGDGLAWVDAAPGQNENTEAGTRVEACLSLATLAHRPAGTKSPTLTTSAKRQATFDKTSLSPPAKSLKTAARDSRF